MTAYAIARICHANSVCLSARLSVTRVYCIKRAERIIEILSLSDRPIILVFRHQWLLWGVPWGINQTEGQLLQGGLANRPCWFCRSVTSWALSSRPVAPRSCLGDSGHTPVTVLTDELNLVEDRRKDTLISNPGQPELA